jgi:hypothetical protein
LAHVLKHIYSHGFNLNFHINENVQGPHLNFMAYERAPETGVTIGPGPTFELHGPT